MRIGVNAALWGQGSDPLEEWYLRNLMAKTMALQPSAKFVVFTSKANDDAFWDFERVRVDDVSMVGRLFRASVHPLASVIAKVGIDYLFTSINAPIIKTDVPCVLYALDLHQVEAHANKTDRAAQRIIKTVKETTSSSRAVVALSDYVRDTLQKTVGVPMDRIKVAPAGLDDLPAEEQSPFIDPPYILITGGTTDTNNVRSALEGFRRLRDEIPHTLVVHGPVGRHEPADWGDRVLRVERCPAAHLAALYQHCAVCVCPAQYDGAGLCVLRALHSGARVVAGRVGGVPAAAGNAPIYCNPESDASIAASIRRAIEEAPEERESAVRIGRKLAAEFTWENCVWKTLVAFRKETN